ncbi:MAG: winged helix-turn-helix transcriptional regulator [Candidatus Thermoplasmatota archaeon]|nr:winged helix-turn-helix transcriptional regulator [Candidatus Thermoplasmatota archaeon]MBU4072057.1 winged helix-turn-helix transcriptional regulator [Candidatus Thermoplasmatota archaeon]MBU4144609.1 winged helix-turn-helix transcriptional regulator [Candidatus Thermoplasmatota archaeon]MBU4592369.1 winged helix-turn-helix transcriptional regulator [Candidatus Thermoplasmatota archaeon]
MMTGGYRPFSSRIYCRKALALLLFSILSFAVFISLAAQGSEAAYVYAPMKDVSAQKNLDIVVSYESLHIISGNSMTFFATVTEHGYPVNGSYVNFSSDAPDICIFDYENNGYTDCDGKLIVQMTVYSEKGMIFNISANAYFEDFMPGYYEIKQITVEPPADMIYNDRISYISITGLIALLAIGSTEAGRYAFMKSLILPLYSRLKKDDLLDHFVRGQIYGYIMSHPGEHYNHIKMKLDVTNGTLSHHLRALEFQGFIKSQRDGTYKRFYPTDMKIPRTKGIQLSDLQLGILDTIRQSPGISQKEIATREGISQQSVSYNLSLLVRMGILDSTKEGIRKRYFMSSEA